MLQNITVIYRSIIHAAFLACFLRYLDGISCGMYHRSIYLAIGQFINPRRATKKRCGDKTTDENLVSRLSEFCLKISGECTHFWSIYLAIINVRHT